MLDAVQEIFFWSGIMRDHAEFQLIALSSREMQSVMAAQNFKRQFEAFSQEAQGLLEVENPNPAPLIAKVIPVLLSFINFKRILVGRLLQCNIEISLTPTFINHMINEAMEFYRVLVMCQKSVTINLVDENVNLHRIWLPDAAGHAASIAADLDATEKEYIAKAQGFEKDFNNLFIKADELGTMLYRTGLCNGTLEHLNRQVESKLCEFIVFLNTIRVLREQCKIMGVIKPLVPDHMIREEEYYLHKIRSYEKMLSK